jgi:hypothetical protein
VAPREDKVLELVVFGLKQATTREQLLETVDDVSAWISSPATAVFDCKRYDLVARVEHIFHLRAVVLEGFVDLGHISADTIVAAVDVVDSNPIGSGVGVQLDLLVESVEQRCVVLQPALVHATDRFDVLLRNPRSPRWFRHGFPA